MRSHQGRPVPDLLKGGQDVFMRYGLPYQWLKCKRTLATVNHDLYVKCAVEACGPGHGRRIVEVGCGVAWNCPLLIMAGFEVVGTDFSSDAIRWAEQLVPDAKFFASDLTRDDIASRIGVDFDVVLAVEVIEHIDPADCREAMGTMRGLSKSDGRLVVTVPSVNLPMDNPEHYRHFTPETLSETIEEGGAWRVREIHGCGDITFYNRYSKWIRPLIDNRLFHARAIDHLLFRHYLAKKRRTSPRRCMNLIAVADPQ